MATSLDKAILHCDLNSFFASVELLDFPDLCDKPVAVAGDPQKRHGIILAKNEAAKRFGVKTAETIQEAKRKCPKLILLPPHHEKYAYFSEQVNLIYLRFTNRIERFGIDESWLDVTKSPKEFGSPTDIANKIRETVKTELGLTISVGVSFNKVFAKLGSDLKKPDAVSVISRENFKDLVWKLPINDMLFVGRKTAEELKKMGIETIGELANYKAEKLQRKFGIFGTQIHENANGIADDNVAFWGEETEAKSLGNSTTFERDLLGEEDISAGLNQLADKVCDRLKEENLYASTVQITIKTADFKSIQRQAALSNPTNSRRVILEEAIKLAKQANAYSYPVRLLGISCSKLSDKSNVQLDFFATPKNEKSEKIEDALLELRKKFGSKSISPASSLFKKKST